MMGYFRGQRKEETYERNFRAPVPEDDEYDEPGMTGPIPDEEEQAYERRERWQLIANIGDFFGVILGAVAILVLVAVIVSLVNWVFADMTQSFTLLQAWI